MITHKCVQDIPRCFQGAKSNCVHSWAHSNPGSLAGLTLEVLGFLVFLILLQRNCRRNIAHNLIIKPHQKFISHEKQFVPSLPTRTKSHLWVRQWRHRKQRQRDRQRLWQQQQQQRPTGFQPMWEPLPSSLPSSSSPASSFLSNVVYFYIFLFLNHSSLPLFLCVILRAYILSPFVPFSIHTTSAWWEPWSVDAAVCDSLRPSLRAVQVRKHHTS